MSNNSVSEVQLQLLEILVQHGCDWEKISAALNVVRPAILADHEWNQVWVNQRQNRQGQGHDSNNQQNQRGNRRRRRRGNRYRRFQNEEENDDDEENEEQECGCCTIL